MSRFVPDAFDVPRRLDGPGFRLEPLGPEHNRRDHEAWMSSIDHIRATPGFADWDWPEPMTLDQNLADLTGHADDFVARRGFTYTILDPDDAVIGCVYIYPTRGAELEADVRSWVDEAHGALDAVVWRTVSEWLDRAWPFGAVHYATRRED